MKHFSKVCIENSHGFKSADTGGIAKCLIGLMGSCMRPQSRMSYICHRSNPEFDRHLVAYVRQEPCDGFDAANTNIPNGFILLFLEGVHLEAMYEG
jgi:hypothetical protein